MHVVSGESGSVLPSRARQALVTLLASASLGCAAARELRVSRGLGDAPQDPAPAQDPVQDTKQEGEGEDPSEEVWPVAQEPPETTAEAGAYESTTSSPSWVHGSLGVRYRGRTNGEDGDNDLRGVLALDVVDPAGTGVAAHVLARVDSDLDGSGSGPFGDLSDTYDGSVVPKLYLAFVDVPLDAQPEESPGILRIGRQSDPLLPEVLRLDGVSYLSRPLGKDEIELGAYAGVPVHLYESSNEGDLAFGTSVEGRFWSGGLARLDWMHLEDEGVLGAGKDDLLALGVWQRLPEHWRFEGEYSHLEGDPRDLRLRALYDDVDSGTIVRAGYYRLLETQRANVTELDPFFEQLLEYSPFHQMTLNVSRAFGEYTTVDVGFDVRRVADSGDVGEFNRDWERYYATSTLSDLWRKGLALTLIIDRWNDEQRDTSSFGVDLAYASEQHWNAAIGTYYSLYKYDLLQFDERDDVRTYYLRAGRDVSANLACDLLYELENDDLDVYQTLRLGVLWRF